MSRPAPRALGLQALAIRLAHDVKMLPTPPGVRRARELARWAIVHDATGGRWSRLSLLPGPEYWTLWRYLDLVEDRARRLVIGEDRLVVSDATGTRSVLWSDVDVVDDQPAGGQAQGQLAEPMARVTDPATSWAAASSLDEETLARQEADALAVIVAAGPAGIHNGGIAARLGRAQNCVSRRVTTLLAKGLVEPAGTVKAASGRGQRVVRATSAGHRLVARHGGHGRQEAS